MTFPDRYRRCFACGGDVNDQLGFPVPPKNRTHCLNCAPEQGKERDPEFDELFQPTAPYVAAIRRLRARMREAGFNPGRAVPLEREWCELNEERFFFGLHEGSSVPETSTVLGTVNEEKTDAPEPESLPKSSF